MRAGGSDAATAVAGREATPPVRGQASVPRPVRVPKMAELVARDLRRRIIRGELEEGDTLPSESVLMEQFGVSRPTLREAFRVLESESLIVIQRGAHGGARVQPPRPAVAARYAGLVLQYQGTTLGDVYDVRSMVEVPCVTALARRRDPEDIARLRTALETTPPAGEGSEQIVRAHNAFHSLLVELTGNRTLILLSEMIQEIVHQANVTRARTDSGTARFEKASRVTNRAHRKLVDLLEAGDTDGAAALWKRHLDEGAVHVLGATGASAPLDVLR